MRSVIAFYRRADWMFRVLSLIRGSPAMHAGLWGPQARSHRAALEAHNRELALRARISDGCRVLDAGCGAGSCALWLARHYDLQVLGITLDLGQARQASNAAGRQGLAGRARFACLDFTGSGLPDAGFDVVWALESVCHAADPAAFLREAYRLLRPGGRLVVSDRFRSEQTADPAGLAALQRWYAGWAFPGLWTAGRFAAAAREIGFRELVCEEMTGRAWPSLRFLGQFAALSLPAALLLQAIGLQSTAQLASIRACIDQYATLRRGLWGYWLIYGQR